MKNPAFRPRNTSRARTLRHEASPAERKLWAALRNSQLDGYKFTRQYQIGPFYGDLLFRSAKLVIELDGFSHESSCVADAARTRFLESEGYCVVRYTNEEVFTNLDGVLIAIGLVLADRPTPNPSRMREGDE